MNDVAFHFVFGRETRKYNLINLLNAILERAGQTPIQDLKLEETEFKPETLGLKSCRLDIRAITSQNHHINIEIQLFNQANIEKRSLYYWSKLYSTQLGEGEDYRELNKTIAINILDFPYLKNQRVHSIYRLLETETLAELAEVLEIHFLELPYLKEYPFDLKCPLTRWLLFMSDQTSQDIKEAILMQDENIQQAYEDLEKLAADKAARRQYELREKAERDYRSNMCAFLEEGRREGLEQGLKEGLKEGLEKGHMRGSEETKAQVVQKMLAEGLGEELIKKITGLSQRELNAMKPSSEGSVERSL